MLFESIEQAFIALLIFSGPLNDEPCIARCTLIDLNP